MLPYISDNGCIIFLKINTFVVTSNTDDIMNIRSLSYHLLKPILIILVIGIPFHSHSAPQLPEAELSWKNIAVESKKTAVFCLFRDSRGIMWLGTNSGLYFYDGVTTHPVGEHELFGTQIYSIVEKDDRLFIGSNNGLLIYDYLSGTVSPSGTATPKEIRTLLLIDENLWIGGLNGIIRLNLKNKKVSDFSKGLPHRSVYSILRDSRGILYAGTYNLSLIHI